MMQGELIGLSTLLGLPNRQELTVYFKLSVMNLSATVADTRLSINA